MRSAAFFDLDRTLVRGSATFPLAVAAFRAGYVPPRQLLHDAVSAMRFVRAGASDEVSAALRERILSAVAGHRAADVLALGDAFLPRLAATVLPESRALLAAHAEAGEDRVIVSASPVEIVGALADRLGLEGAVGTRSEIDAEGRYTGRLAGPFCYREGKVDEIRRLAAERGYDLARSTAYSDSVSDLPFLEAVGSAVAVNPDSELRALAQERGWRVVEVARPGRARASRALRLVATGFRPRRRGVPAGESGQAGRRTTTRGGAMSVRDGLVRGAAAGTVGTAAMSVLMLGARRAGLLGAQPPEAIVRAGARALTGREPSGRAARLAAVGAHVGFGATGGAAYGLLPPLPGPAVVRGGAAGLLVWALSYEGWVPVLGALPPAHRDRDDRVAVMVAAHLVYGAVLGVLDARWRRPAA